MRKSLTFGLALALSAISFSASAQLAYATRSVNLRAGPDTSYPPITVIAPGAPVQVMGCLDDWSWCDVVYGDTRGWMYAPYMNYDYQGARVPFYSYAPAFGIPIVTFALGSYWDSYYRGRDFYGRRDYWGGRSFVHVRPSGPAPRASIPSSFRANRGDNRGSGFTGRGDNRPSREVNVPGRGDNRAAQVGGVGKPSPTVGRAQEMHRGAPAAPAGPATRAAPQGHAPQGNAPQGRPQGNAPQGRPQGNAPQGHPQGNAPQGHPQGNAPQGHPQGNAGHGNDHAGGKDEKHN